MRGEWEGHNGEVYGEHGFIQLDKTKIAILRIESVVYVFRKDENGISSFDHVVVKCTFA
jgi:hypothetical protein